MSILRATHSLCRLFILRAAHSLCFNRLDLFTLKYQIKEQHFKASHHEVPFSQLLLVQNIFQQISIEHL